MRFGMKGFRREHEGKLLRIEFTDGEICEGDLLMVCSCDEHADCCGIVFKAKAFERTARPVTGSEVEL